MEGNLFWVNLPCNPCVDEISLKRLLEKFTGKMKNSWEGCGLLSNRSRTCHVTSRIDARDSPEFRVIKVDFSSLSFWITRRKQNLRFFPCWLVSLPLFVCTRFTNSVRFFPYEFYVFARVLLFFSSSISFFLFHYNENHEINVENNVTFCDSAYPL